MKHLHPNADDRLTVIASGAIDPIQRQTLYSINRLGDAVAEPQPDGSVLTRRPVATVTHIDFAHLNEEALLAIVEDRLADRAAGEFGTKRIDSALRHARKALEIVRADARNPMRRRSQVAPGVAVVDADDDAAPSAAVAPPAIPGMVIDENGVA